jgi:hypothetical protein
LVCAKSYTPEIAATLAGFDARIDLDWRHIQHTIALLGNPPALLEGMETLKQKYFGEAMAQQKLAHEAGRTDGNYPWSREDYRAVCVPLLNTLARRAPTRRWCKPARRRARR